MRSDEPTNSAQHPGLGAVGQRASTGESAPRLVNRGLELRQIAGLHAGGRIELPIGSYRFGPKSGATALGNGRVEDAVFGLTVDPGAEVMLVIGSAPVQLDGVTITESQPIVPGQIIAAGGSRFELAANDASPSSDTNPPVPANPPASSKGRKADPDVVAWANAQRRQAAVARRAAIATPFDISHRSKVGPSAFFLDTAASPGFGQVPIGFVDSPYTFTGNLSTVNGPTKKHLHTIEILPSTPVMIDLLTESVAVVGTRQTARAVATWIALAVAVTSRPDAAGIMLCARGQRGDWSWIDAVPHPDELATSPLNVVVFDETDSPDAVPQRGTVVVVEQDQAIPNGVGAIIELAKNGPTFSSGGERVTGMTPIGVSSMFALETVFQINDHFHTTEVVR